MQQTPSIFKRTPFSILVQDLLRERSLSFAEHLKSCIDGTIESMPHFERLITGVTTGSSLGYRITRIADQPMFQFSEFLDDSGAMPLTVLDLLLFYIWTSNPDVHRELTAMLGRIHRGVADDAPEIARLLNFEGADQKIIIGKVATRENAVHKPQLSLRVNASRSKIEIIPAVNYGEGNNTRPLSLHISTVIKLGKILESYREDLVTIAQMFHGEHIVMALPTIGEMISLTPPQNVVQKITTDEKAA